VVHVGRISPGRSRLRIVGAHPHHLTGSSCGSGRRRLSRRAGAMPLFALSVRRPRGRRRRGLPSPSASAPRSSRSTRCSCTAGWTSARPSRPRSSGRGFRITCSMWPSPQAVQYRAARRWRGDRRDPWARRQCFWWVARRYARGGGQLGFPRTDRTPRRTGAGPRWSGQPDKRLTRPTPASAKIGRRPRTVQALRWPGSRPSFSASPGWECTNPWVAPRASPGPAPSRIRPVSNARTRLARRVRTLVHGFSS
jgi:hypothetical protein